MTARENAEAWIKSLKPGDKVIRKSWSCADKILTVEKITPSGIIRTNDGSFKLSKYGSIPTEYGGYSYSIIPYDEVNAKEAIAYQERVAAERRKEALIRRAKDICYDLCYGKTSITEDMAKTIIGLFR